ncbi:hypothetical protein ACRALDRAFT_213103 [Sodiomyces alcalophilus JCM 7366]|uniref:uncharacterized protein n=1 Tax=Sodiomyces alcalophilus JCM 7366 TaxID=591952 RepID=UPI0039B6CB69
MYHLCCKHFLGHLNQAPDERARALGPNHLACSGMPPSGWPQVLPRSLSTSVQKPDASSMHHRPPMEFDGDVALNASEARVLPVFHVQMLGQLRNTNSLQIICLDIHAVTADNIPSVPSSRTGGGLGMSATASAKRRFVHPSTRNWDTIETMSDIDWLTEVAKMAFPSLNGVSACCLNKKGIDDIAILRQHCKNRDNEEEERNETKLAVSSMFLSGVTVGDMSHPAAGMEASCIVHQPLHSAAHGFLCCLITNTHERFPAISFKCVYMLTSSSLFPFLPQVQPGAIAWNPIHIETRQTMHSEKKKQAEETRKWVMKSPCSRFLNLLAQNFYAAI